VKRKPTAANPKAKTILRLPDLDQAKSAVLYRERLIALYGFIKKTRTAPEDDVALARKRQKLER